jgi:hypothetical protein
MTPGGILHGVDMMADDAAPSVPMEEDDSTLMANAYQLRQDPNDWIPKAEEARRDAEAFLPRIVSAILSGAQAKDWNRQSQPTTILPHRTPTQRVSCD